MSGSYLIIDPDSKEELLTALNEDFKDSHGVEIRFHPDDIGISIWIAGYIWKNETVEDIVFDVHIPSVGKFKKISLSEAVSFIERIYNLKYLA